MPNVLELYLLQESGFALPGDLRELLVPYFANEGDDPFLVALPRRGNIEQGVIASPPFSRITATRSSRSRGISGGVGMRQTHCCRHNQPIRFRRRRIDTR